MFNHYLFFAIVWIKITMELTKQWQERIFVGFLLYVCDTLIYFYEINYSLC